MKPEVAYTCMWISPFRLIFRGRRQLETGEGDQALMGRRMGRDRGLRQALGGAESRAESLQVVLGEI